MNNADLLQYLRGKNACSEAIEWIGDRDLEAAWRDCDRSVWMVWLWASTGNVRPLVKAAVDIAETVLPVFERVYPDDPRPRRAVEAARSEVDGVGTVSRLPYKAALRAVCSSNDAFDAHDQQCNSASDAADAAAHAAYAVYLLNRDRIESAASAASSVIYCATDVSDNVTPADLLRKYLACPVLEGT